MGWWGGGRRKHVEPAVPAKAVTQIAARPAPVPAARRTGHITCPFCTLLCDDVRVEPAADGRALRIGGTTCPRAIAGFERALPAAQPQIAGRDVTLDEALAAAADILRAARLPLIGGLATDVDGMRGLLALADRAGGVVDHAGSAAAFHNVAVLQSRGWVMSTLSEVRNRADLVIVVGDGIGAAFPRVYERVLAPAEAMFTAPMGRTIVWLGSGEDRALVPPSVKGIALPCRTEALGGFVGALRAALKGTPVPPQPSLDMAAIGDLAGLIRAAAYPVIVWAPALLPAADGDLVVLSICDLVRDLNVAQRAAGLSLGGSEGGQTALSVTAWQTGYPLRVSLATGKPIHDPQRFDIARMLAAGEGDALVWTASFSPDLLPPPTSVPIVLLATPGLVPETPTAVTIPVGTPGLDHRGDLVRCDGVVTLPLAGLRDVGLPRVADVAAAITARLAST